MIDYKNNQRLRHFEISADGGNTWTYQIMTYQEAANEVIMGRIVKHRVMQKYQSCGALFYVAYRSDGTYEYMNDACDCESEFRTYSPDEPSLSEFMSMLREGSSNGKTSTRI